MKHYFLYVFIFLILGTNDLVIGQAISGEEKIKIGHIVASKIGDLYPYPEISKKVVNGIYEGFSNHAFENINTYAEFAVKMTELVEELSNDKHLDLIYNPALAVKMKSGVRKDNFMAKEEAEIERWNNYGFEKLAILEGNIGYMNLSVFFDLSYASKTADHAMGYFANSNGLIIDLRQNGGGWGEMVTFLLAYFIESPGPGTLRVLQSTLDSSYTSSYIPPAVNGKRLLDIPVYILISRATASAAESFSTNMKFLNNNVVLIGERTRGAENPIDYAVVDENFILQLPSYRIIYSLNPYRWERIGIEPDIEIDPEYAKENAHKMMLHDLLLNCKDSISKTKYQWALDGIEASYDKADIRMLKELTGFYGKYKVYIEDGIMYCQYNGSTPRKLLPVNEKYFVVEGVQYYRVLFIKDENGERMRRIFYYGDMQDISKR